MKTYRTSPGEPGRLAQWEAEHTAAAKAEVEAELAARLNGDGG